ncbi:hypothetical protein MCEREM30_00825 [Paracoccaceae bacterium]
MCSKNDRKKPGAARDIEINPYETSYYLNIPTIKIRPSGGVEDLRAPVVSRCNSPPVHEPPEHDLDPVAAFVATLVVLDWLATGFPAWDARLYPLVFQRICEPVSVIAPVGQQPLRLWQAAQQGRRAGIVADLACGHEEADRAAIGLGDGMQIGVHAALGSADQTAPLVACPPFFDRRLVAVRCTFR